MKYFIDTEFIEGFHKPLFGKRRHFIDLISIGIVAEDGREYSAISNEFNPADADQWVKENVLKEIYWTLCLRDDEMQAQGTFSMWGTGTGMHEFRRLLKAYGKSNAQIAFEIHKFIFPQLDCTDRTASIEAKSTLPTFYGYYADYDWVLFCSLFGRMIDLPKGFPMYMNDLKQTVDEINERRLAMGNIATNIRFSGAVPEGYGTRIHQLPDYPKQTKEHDALSDARWNKALHDFLTTL